MHFLIMHYLNSSNYRFVVRVIFIVQYPGNKSIVAIQRPESEAICFIANEIMLTFVFLFELGGGGGGGYGGGGGGGGGEYDPVKCA